MCRKTTSEWLSCIRHGGSRTWAESCPVMIGSQLDWVGPAILSSWILIIPLLCSVLWVVNQLSIHKLPKKAPWTENSCQICPLPDPLQWKFQTLYCCRHRCQVAVGYTTRLHPPGPPDVADVVAPLSQALAFSGYWVCRRTGPYVYPLHLLRQAGSSCWHEWTGLSIMQEELKGERLCLSKDHYLSNYPA